MEHLLRHLFDTRGFPTASTYGGSWEPWLIRVFVYSKAISILSIVLFFLVFVRTALAVHRSKFDFEIAKSHLFPVFIVLSIAAGFRVVLEVWQGIGMFCPAFRALGIFSLLASVMFLVASYKAWYAYRSCLKPENLAVDDAGT